MAGALPKGCEMHQETRKTAQDDQATTINQVPGVLRLLQELSQSALFVPYKPVR